jgi:hypothetical protein
MGQHYFYFTLYSSVPVLAPNKGRAMAQAVSHWPLTAEARVLARVNPRGICGGQSGTGAGFSPTSSGFPCQYCNKFAGSISRWKFITLKTQYTTLDYSLQPF